MVESSLSTFLDGWFGNKKSTVSNGFAVGCITGRSSGRVFGFWSFGCGPNRSNTDFLILVEAGWQTCDWVFGLSCGRSTIELDSHADETFCTFSSTTIWRAVSTRGTKFVLICALCNWFELLRTAGFCGSSQKSHCGGCSRIEFCTAFVRFVPSFRLIFKLSALLNLPSSKGFVIAVRLYSHFDVDGINCEAFREYSTFALFVPLKNGLDRWIGVFDVVRPAGNDG